MIEKIVSGGQTGVDRAALDAAIELSIPHGGWLPKGRKAEDGPVPEKYLLKELPTASYRERTSRNVVDSDGTLIISRGPLDGGSAYTQKVAEARGKPYFHVDLKQIQAFMAVSQILEWLLESRVQVLNVAGPRASKDPDIYASAKKIIEGVYYLCLVKTNMPDVNPTSGAMPAAPPMNVPASVDAAIARIISRMPLKDKATVANMTEREVLRLDSTLGRYISDKLDLWAGNKSFMASYLELTGSTYDSTEAPVVMLRELWEKLKATHKLRVVK